jgi:plasmid stabilization system protein ParE
MTRIVQRTEAELDLVEAFVFLGNESIVSARLFLQRAQETFHLLAEQPEIGWKLESKNPSLQNIRKFPVKGFPKLIIFYRPIDDGDDGIEVLRVLHGSLELAGSFGL